MVLDEGDSYKKLEKRPVPAGLFIIFGSDEQDDYFYPRGILHRERAGRSWAVETPQIALGWSENKQSKKQHRTIDLRKGLFGLLSCLPNRATEHNCTGATTKRQIKQPQDQEKPDNMKGGKK